MMQSAQTNKLSCCITLKRRNVDFIAIRKQLKLKGADDNNASLSQYNIAEVYIAI